jgi:hypothetical protein
MTDTHRRRTPRARGITLLETILVLVLMGTFTAAAIRGSARLRDRWAVAAARDALAGVLREARGVAVGRGGATVTLLASPAEIVLASSADVVRRIDLAREWGVGLDLGVGRTRVDFHFDAAGVGRMAARTVRVTLGRAEAVLVVSGYGRVRR